MMVVDCQPDDIDTDLWRDLNNIAEKYGFEVHGIGDLDGSIIFALKPGSIDLGISVCESVGTADRTGG